MENWYLILIDLAVLAFFGGLFYLALKKVTLRRAKKGVLYIIHDILRDIKSQESMPESMTQADLIRAREIMLSLDKEKVVEAGYDYEFIMTELDYLIKN